MRDEEVIARYDEVTRRASLWGRPEIRSFLGLSGPGGQIKKLWWACENYLTGEYTSWPAPVMPHKGARSCAGTRDVVRGEWPLDSRALPPPDRWVDGTPQWREGTVWQWALWCGRVRLDGTPATVQRGGRIPEAGDRTYDDLVRRIRAGELRQGDQLPTLAVTEGRYGVGVDTARAAYRRLVTNGLVERSGYRYIVR